MGADGEVFVVLEEALRGGFSRSRSGKPGTVSSQPQWTASVHMRWRAEVSRLMVPVAAPGGAPDELILTDLVRGQRGGPRVAAEERGEMGDPAAGGVVGPELPHLVVLEVGVAEISQGRPLGAERARRRCRRGGAPGWWSSRSRAGSWAGFLLCGGRGQAASVHIRSGGRDRQVECAEAK